MTELNIHKVPNDLLAKAKEAWQHAYAPYSKFHVGASLRADNSLIFSGANIENSSFGLTRCAEQSAIQAMASSGQRSFSEIVIYTQSPHPASPCGACRQILFEFNRHATVYLVNHNKIVISYNVSELLPGGFHFDDV